MDDTSFFVAQLRTDGTTWIAISVGILAIAYVMLRPRLTKKDPLEHRPISSSLAQQRSVERQMSNLLVELSEMSRTIRASLDTRVYALMDQGQSISEIAAQLDRPRGEIELILALRPRQVPLPHAS